jgi:hypothetical protein
MPNGSVVSWVVCGSLNFSLCTWVKSIGDTGKKWEQVVWVGKVLLKEWAERKGIQLMKKSLKGSGSSEKKDATPSRKASSSGKKSGKEKR